MLSAFFLLVDFFFRVWLRGFACITNCFDTTRSFPCFPALEISLRASAGRITLREGIPWSLASMANIFSGGDERDPEGLRFL